MQVLLSNLPRTLTFLLVVVLAAASLALLLEGARRWFWSRGSNRALKRLAEAQKGAESPEEKPGSLLQGGTQANLPPWLEEIFLRLPHREDLQRLIEQSGSRWSVSTLQTACVGMAAVVALVAFTLTRSFGVSQGLLITVVMTVVGGFLPIGFLKVQAGRRFRAFEENFAESIDLLARACRAGHSLAAGFQVVGEEAEEPVASEFRQVHEEQRFGLPLRDSLLALADRIALVDVRIFVTAVLIQRESGGNLAENLNGLSEVIRQRFRFKRDVRTKTAHGRMTGMIVGVAPLVSGFLMYSVNPDYMAPLIEQPLGRTMLFAGGAMMVVGFLVIRHLVDIKV